MRKKTLDSKHGDMAGPHACAAAIDTQALGAAAFVRNPCLVLAPSQPSTMLRKTLLLIGCALVFAEPARAAGDAKDDTACEAAGRAVASMSAVQRERFEQTLQTAAPCAGELAVHGPTSARRESVHLQLFNGARAHMAGRDAQRSVASRVSGSTVLAAQPPPRAVSARSRAVELAPVVDAAARRHNIDPLLLHAIAHVESRHDPRARSHAGALGVMQIMPGTGQRFGVADRAALHHVPTNLEVSATYLKTLQDRFGNNLPLVLAAYNAGEGAVERHGRRIPPFAETRRYVADVMATYERLGAAARQVRPRALPRGPADML